MTSARKLLGLVLLAVFSLSVVAHGSAKFKTAVSYAVGTKPSAAAVGDFNGDGKLDIAVVNSGDASVGENGGLSILMGNGDGTFQSAMNFSAGNNPGSVAVGDFDGDGKADLAVQRLGNGNNDSGDVTIFISNGDGTFKKGQVFTSVVLPSSLVTADFDSDGTLDLAAFQQTFGLVKVFLGKGDGTFSAPTAYATPSTSVAKKLEVLDFNRDGKKDIAVTGFGGGGSILIGNGDGTFQAGTSLGTYQTFDSLEFVADFNHDGNVDAILTHCILSGWPPKSNCTEQAQLNNGNGTISPAPVIAALMNQTTTPGDFDGDGNPDMAGVASGSSPLAIFAGNGDGSFQQPVTFPASSALSAVALSADLNNDSAPDLISINIDNTISVILNSGTDFSISATPLIPGSIGAGQSAASTVGLDLLNLFNNPVSLSCSVQPAQAGAPTFSLSSNSVTFDSSGKASATLTITAGSSAASLIPSPFRGHLSNLGFLWMPIAAFAFLGAGFGVDLSRRRRALIVPLAAVLFSGLATQLACGGGASGPKATGYTVTITGISGATQHSTSVNVTAQ